MVAASEVCHSKFKGIMKCYVVHDPNPVPPGRVLFTFCLVPSHLQMFYHKLRLDGRFTAEQELPVLLTIAQSLIRNFITVYARGNEQVACLQVLVKLDKCVLAAVRRLKRVGSEDEMLFHHLVTREMCGSMYYLAALYCLKYATPDNEDRMVCGWVGVRTCRSGCVGWGGDVGVGVSSGVEM